MPLFKLVYDLFWKPHVSLICTNHIITQILTQNEKLVSKLVQLQASSSPEYLLLWV
jgi:hypothetical protein